MILPAHFSTGDANDFDPTNWKNNSVPISYFMNDNKKFKRRLEPETATSIRLHSFSW